MPSTVFQPPNLHSLSQDTIGNVFQRIRTSDHSVIPINPVPDRSKNNHSVSKGNDSFRSGLTQLVNIPPETRSSISVVDIRPDKYVVEGDDHFSDANIHATNREQYQNCRERHRKNQERYRLRQKKLANDLDCTNRLLRDEVLHLKSQYNRLFIGISPHVTLQAAVDEYFRVFRHGFVEPDGSRIAELDFLRLSMSPDLDAGSVFGFEALARNWGILSLFFRYVRVHLEGMEHIGENSLVAKTITSVTVTTTTLRDVFLYPEDLQLERWSQIIAKLLGQRLVMHGSVRFSWNNLTNRVDGLLSQSDMVSPLLQLLGNIEDVSIVLNKARLTPEGNLVVGDYLSQYPMYK